MEWNGPAYDSGSNTLYIPAVDWCGTFSKAPKDPPIMKGMHYYGGAVASDPREKSKGWLTALDASTGKERWKYASPTPLVAGVTATSGGVLFTGDLNNDFLALDAKTGQVLYRFNTGGSIGVASSITHRTENNMSRRRQVRSPPSLAARASRPSRSSPFPNPKKNEEHSS
jgi:alcohol dehydrogenase (cytochrome c)